MQHRNENIINSSSIFNINDISQNDDNFMKIMMDKAPGDIIYAPDSGHKADTWPYEQGMVKCDMNEVKKNPAFASSIKKVMGEPDHFTEATASFDLQFKLGILEAVFGSEVMNNVKNEKYITQSVNKPAFLNESCNPGCLSPMSTVRI